MSSENESQVEKNDIEKELQAKASIYSFCGKSTLNIPKILIRNLGLTTSALIESLITKEKYFFERNMLDDEGFFWNTEEDRQDDCGLTPYQQTQAITLLESLEILYPVKRTGLPARQRFKINYQKFENQLLKFKELDAKNLRTIFNKNKSNKNKSNKVSLRKDKDTIEEPEAPIDFSSIIVSRQSRRKIPHNQELPSSLPNSSLSSTPPKINWLDNSKKVLIDEWNKIPQVTHHANLTTNLACNINKWIEYIKHGSFFDQCKIDDEFMKKNNIPLRWASNHEKFSERDILKAIKGFSLYWKDEYWPPTKKGLPRSMADFIYRYNYQTKTGTSYLFKLLANPEVKSFAEQRKLKDFNPQYTQYFAKKQLLQYFKEDDLPNVYRGIQAIETRVIRDKVFDFANGSTNPDLKRAIGVGPGKLEPMFEKYANYLAHEYNRLEPERIFSQYGYFQDFLQYLKDEYSGFKVRL